MRQQLFGSMFGRNPFRVPDLNNVEMHCDRGYFSETTFLTILSVPAAGETSGAEYDGDQSGDEERSTTEESAMTPH